MTQSWGSPPNPRRTQPQPPESRYELIVPEDDYYYPPTDPQVKRGLYFFAGGCSTAVVVLVSLLGVMLCVCSMAFLWVLDDRIGITAADQSNPIGVPLPTIVLTPTPNTGFIDPGTLPTSTPTPYTPGLPFAIGQPILAGESGVELTVWDIQRNIQPNNLQAAPGLEFVAVSVQLSNAGNVGAQEYQAINFQLQDAEGNFFPPDLQADNGRRLRSGELTPGGAIEGDLLFHIPLGHAPLTLVWQPVDSIDFYLVELQ